MKLYYNPMSTYCQKVLIAFHETGIKFEPEILNLMDEQTKTDYRKIYPIGKIPLLILDDGHPIPESTIIIEYLNGLSEQVKLIPEDPTEARKTRFLDRMYDFYLNNPIGTKFFELLKPEAEQSQKVLDDCDEKINIMYDNMENNFSDKVWNRGDMFTMADCACIPALFYAQQIAPFSDRSRIQAYWDRACERESVQKVHQEAKPYLQAFQNS